MSIAPERSSARNRLPNRLIRASAGTGKTFQLSNRYLQLILAGHPADRILASTFTRKAAGEILERILLRLAMGSVDQAGADRLATELGQAGLTVEENRRALKNLTRNLHRLRISTLDSFFLQATQTLSLELGLPPGWSIVDEIEDEALRDEALASLLAEDDPRDIMRLVHWLAKGETVRSIHRLLRDTVRSMYAMFLEAPAEAWQRLRPAQPLTPQAVSSLLFQLEGLAQGDVLKKQLATAIDKLVCETRDESWADVLKSTVIGNIVSGTLTYYRSPIPPEALEPLRALATHAQAQFVNLLVHQTQASYQLLERFHGHYQGLKIQRRALRFDDLPRYLARLRESRHLRHLAYRLDASIDSLLLDEFQDTSLLQWQVLQSFAHHAAQPELDRSFFCVGDVKQAIYGWRGGNAELLHAVAQDIPSMQDQRLDCSFRSARPVIDAVNEINHNLLRHPNLDREKPAVRGWCEAFPLHDTKRDELSGYVTLETHRAGVDGDDENQQAIALTVRRVAELRAAAPHLSIAVLTRTNEMVAQVIFELQRRGIAASQEAGNPLTDSAAVQLVMSLLQLVDYPGDTAARYHLATSPWAPQLGLTSVTDDMGAIKLTQGIRSQLASDGYGEVIAGWSEQLRPFANPREMRRLGQLTELAYQYQQQVETPRTIGFQRQQRQPLRTADFLRRIERKTISDPTEDPVRVMNVHQSKGLQFDVVLLPDLESTIGGNHTPTFVASRPQPTEPIDRVLRHVPNALQPLLPAWVGQMHDDYFRMRVEEELCVLYVALTRAIHALHMVIAPSSYRDDPDEPPAKKKANQDKMPRSVAGLLRAALVGNEPVEAETLLYERGDPNWLAHSPASRHEAGPDRLTTLPRVALAPPSGTSPGRGDVSISPSELEGGGRVSLQQQLALPNQRAMARGTLIHAFFEQIEWLDEGPPEASVLQSEGAARDADRESVELAIADFYRQIQQPEVFQALCRSGYQRWLQQYETDPALRSTAGSSASPNGLDLQVRREQRLTSRDRQGLMLGYIDRLVLLLRNGRPIAAEVLDFKTDQISSEQELQQRLAHYHPQMYAYGRGVSRMMNVPPQCVTVRLVFLAAGRVVDVDWRAARDG